MTPLGLVIGGIISILLGVISYFVSIEKYAMEYLLLSAACIITGIAAILIAIGMYMGGAQ